MKKANKKFLKIVLFDEDAAQNYLDITNGGRLDWSKEENKKRVAELLAEIEAQVKGGFNIVTFLKGSLSGGLDTKVEGNISKILDKTIKNTLLTDYIDKAIKDKNVYKFEKKEVYAPENSITLYKMYSSYLTIVPQSELPIDMEKLNKAVLGERGYYAMLIRDETVSKNVLRFNIKAFKNNYNLADLSKMKLTYYGVKVGNCKRSELEISHEFEVKSQKKIITAEEILGEDVNEGNNSDNMDVYDVVLAGVLA